MSRKKSSSKKNIPLDAKYKSSIIPKLINSLMYDGKKTIAEKIVYDAIEKIKSKSKDEPITIFNQAITNIKPTVEVRSRRVGGATYQVPMEVRPKRAQTLAMKWIVDSAIKRNEKTMKERVANEIIDAFNNKGNAVKKREETHKMADANRAFSHFRW